MSGYTPKQYEVVIDRYQMIRNKSPEFVQYDTETAKLNLVFLENGIPFIIPYERLVLIIKKPDQKEVYQNIETFSRNTAEVILHNQALTVAGTLQCQIKMYQESKLESTWTFEVKVKPSIGNEDVIKSTDEYQVLQQLFMDVDSKKDEMEQAITENINQNNSATQQNINAMKAATDAAIKSIDESAVGALNQQVLTSNYQTFTAIGSMSRVGENKVATQSNLIGTLELGEDDYEQIELLETPSTLEEPMEGLDLDEGIAVIPEIHSISTNEIVPIESGFAKSANLEGHTLVNIAPIYYGAGDVKLSDEVTIKANVENAVANYRVKWFRPIHSLKPNTKYLIKFYITELNNIVGLSSYLKYDNGEYTYGIFQGLTSVGRYSIPFTTDSRNCTEIAIYTQKSDEETIYAKIKGVMVFEYVEGMETWDIPYFTGMQSVRMPVQTSVGKNLFDKLSFVFIEENLYGFSKILGHSNRNSYTLSLRDRDPSVSVDDCYIGFTGNGKDATNDHEWLLGNGVILFNGVLTSSALPFISVFPRNKETVEKITQRFYVQLEIGTNNTEYEPFRSNILSIDGEYGSVGDVRDTVNLITGEVIQRTDLRPYQEGDESNPDVITDMTNTRYKLPKEVVKTVDLSNKPFFFKDGHIILSSASDEESLLPTLEYTVPTNIRSQADNNAESLLKLEKTKVDVESVDINSKPHTVVKRNSDGNIKVGNAIEFKTAILNQKHPVQVIEDAHLKVGNRNVWDDGNLIVETGTFTPYGYGGDNAQQFTHVTQTGKYYKVGRMVTVVGEIVADNFNSATGHFRIGGLPFRIRECHTPCSIGYIRGIKTDSSDIQINVFGELGYAFLQFAMNNTNTGAAWSNVTVDKLISRLGISFSMTYLTD